ncbi:MAG: hypothetical protein ACXWUF_08745 [Methylomagnum sp.]
MKQVNYLHGVHEQLQRFLENTKPLKPENVKRPESRPTVKLRMADEILDLYHAISSLLPLVQGRAIEFIGSGDEEGTSTIASEFAWVAHEKFNKSVLILDADSLRLSQHSFFNMAPGLSWDDVLKSGSRLETAIYPVAGPRFCISYLTQVDSPNTLSRSLINQSIDYLRENFDLIIIDPPPAFYSSLGIDCCRAVDGVVLVMEADSSRWPVIQTIKQKIQREGGNILGVVFNKRRHYIPNFIYKLL